MLFAACPVSEVPGQHGWPHHYKRFKQWKGSDHAMNRVVSLSAASADDLKPRQGRVAELYVYDNFARVPAESVLAGDICALTGLGDVTIGETICDKDVPTALPTITVSSFALGMHQARVLGRQP